MSRDGYLPPGCSYSDLPGWNDIDIDFTFTCPDCGEFDECVTTDDKWGGEVEGTCPDCGKLVRDEYDPHLWDDHRPFVPRPRA